MSIFYINIDRNTFRKKERTTLKLLDVLKKKGKKEKKHVGPTATLSTCINIDIKNKI